MARTSTKKSQAQNFDLNKAETMAIGSFMKRFVAAGMTDITLSGMSDVRRLYRCLSVMRSNTIKFMNDELTHEELVTEHDKSFGFWSGENSNDFDSFA